MSKLLKTAFSLAALSLLCSSLQASSFIYTFTFNATSISNLTSFTLTSPTLLPDTLQRFSGASFSVIDAPGPGATLPASLPIIALNPAKPGIFVPFSQTSPSAALWQFTGITAALTAPGTYAFESGSTVQRSIKLDSPTDPVTGFIKIANVPSTATPEPTAWGLSGAGLALFAFIRHRRTKRL